jgi:hypothetical protein
MAMTPEAKVKNKAVKQLKELGAYYFFPATAGFGKSGVPDIVAATKGCSLGSNVRQVKTHPRLYKRRT